MQCPEREDNNIQSMFTTSERKNIVYLQYQTWGKIIANICSEYFQKKNNSEFVVQYFLRI